MTASEPVPPAAPAWQRLHPLTPWLRGWAIIVVLIGIVVREAQNDLSDLMAIGRLAGIGGIAGVIAGVLIIATAYNLVWWRMARFRIGESVDLTTGVLFRQSRSLRLDQLEAVDIVHPLVARLFGLVELRLESAGGAQSYLSLRYLRAAQAEAVRAEVLSHKVPGPSSEPDASPATSPAQSFRVPPAWTLRAYFRTWEPWFSFFIAVMVIVGSIGTGTWGGLLAALPFLLGFGQAFWKYIVTEMGFTGSVSPDGIHLTHGLTTTVHQSIPARRIQAVRLHQRFWWRGPDWWRIDLNVAGYGVAHDQNRTVLITVADPAMAMAALTAAMPRATVPESWAVIDRAMHGTGPEPGFTGSPPAARLFDPWVWRRQGYARTPYALILRTGRFTRTVTIVPHDRIQGLSADAGVWDRHRGLASATLHSTRGPVSARILHLASADVARLLVEETPLIGAAPGPGDTPATGV